MSIRWEHAPWRRLAACLKPELDPDLWFPAPPPSPCEVAKFQAKGITVPESRPRNAIDARRICVGYRDKDGFNVYGCQAAEECALWAVTTRQQSGIFGGLGADGKLKWLRSELWGADADPAEPEDDAIDIDPIVLLSPWEPELPEGADLDSIRRLIVQEQNALRRDFGIDTTARDWSPAARCERCGDWIPAGCHPPDRNTAGATCGRGVTYAKGCRCYGCRCANSRRDR